MIRFFVKLLKPFLFIVLVVGIAHAEEGSRTTLRERIKEKLATRADNSEKKQERSKTGSTPKVSIGGRNVSIWENQKAEAGVSPLIIFSHGFHGCSTQSKSLMNEIAKNGFTIVAPDHADASCSAAKSAMFERANPKFNEPDKWNEETFKERKTDIEEVIKGLRADPVWSKKLDFSNISLIGHSLGGYTVLALAGAWPSWKMKDVKAVLALSPYSQPFIDRHTIGNIDVPIMFQGGTRDFGITPSILKSGGAYDQARSPAYFVNFQDAGHFSWTDINKKQLKTVSSYSVSFLKKYAQGDSLSDPGKSEPEVKEIRKK